MYVVIIGLLTAVLGLIILYEGVQLILVSGSYFYIVMGLGLLAAAVQLMRRRQSGMLIYAVLLIVTFLWTLYEVGLDKWQWIPRGALLTFIGLLLALPYVPRMLKDGRTASRFGSRNGVLLLRTTVAAIALIGAICWFYDPRRIDGELPLAKPQPDPAADGNTNYPANDWVAYGGTNLGQRYSSLSDINTENVGKLKLVWEHHTGDLKTGDDPGEYTFEATPLKVNNLLYLCTPHNIVEALVPETGEVRWKFNPDLKPDSFTQHQTCRGVSYNDSSGVPTLPAPPATPGQAAGAPLTNTCPRRVIATTVDARLFAINADTGQPCVEFGENGFVNLLEQMPQLRRADYMQTSAPLVTKNLIVIGGAISDNYYQENTSGVIRAYDVRTGRLVWKFDAGRPNETAPLRPGETYQANSPTAWATLSADEALGLVYVPFGNKSPDQFGMERTDEDAEFVDALVALDINTGAVRWKFQTSYHDLWDRDNPSQPTLLDLPRSGQSVPSIIIPTKGGNLWVLDRRDGTPVLPVTEVKVRADTDVPNEKPSKVQPVSSLNFTPAPLREADMWGVSPIDQIACRITYRQQLRRESLDAANTCGFARVAWKHRCVQLGLDRSRSSQQMADRHAPISALPLSCLCPAA